MQVLKHLPEGVIAVEVPHNEEISVGKNRGRKGVGSTIRQGGANRGRHIH